MIRHASLFSALALATCVALPTFGQQQAPVQQQMPVQQAAVAAPPQAGAGTRVLVIPFTTLNVGDNQEWIGRAVQEDIIADFGRTNQFMPVAFQGQLLVEDNATAVSLAHKADANLVIRGSAQMVDKDLRITAQMIDARTGDTVTTASVTGPATDLLKLEDGLSSQLRTNLATAEASQAAAAQPAVPAAGPVTYAPPAPVYASPSYTPGYSYPYTPVYTTPDYNYAPYPYYDYGYLGGPVVIYGGGFGFRTFRGGFHGGGFGGGFGGGGFHGGGGFGGGGFHGGGGFGGGFHGGGGGGGGGHR